MLTSVTIILLGIAMIMQGINLMRLQRSVAELMHDRGMERTGFVRSE